MMVEKHMLAFSRVHGDIRASGIFISEEGKPIECYPKHNQDIEIIYLLL